MSTTKVTPTSSFKGLQSGEMLAEYKILSLLGSGPVGRVYRVNSSTTDRVEAMKVVQPDLAADSGWVERLLRETPAWASLAHPNIAAPRVVQRIDGQVVLLTDFLKGSSLDELMEASRIPLKDAVGYISQVLCGLAHAHSLGVLHRDIKPSNIMVTTEGLVKLMDFGIAALANGWRFQKPGGAEGPAQYKSPEAIQGQYLDQRSDIYSLGVVLYQLATGQAPFAGSEEEIMAAHLEVAPRHPHAVDSSLPAALNDIILTALAKDPAERFQTAAAFHAALARVAFPLMTLPAERVPKAVSAPGWHGPRMAYGLVNLMILLALLAAIAAAGISQYRRVHPRSQPVVFSQTFGPIVGRSFGQWTSGAVERTVGAPSRIANQSKPAASPRAAGGEPVDMTQFAAPREVGSAAVSPRAVAAPRAPYLSLVELRGRLARIAARAAVVDAVLQDRRRRPATIPPTILAAQERLHSDLNAAEASFDRNDLISGKLTLDATERDLEQIDSFLHQ